jgi:hypothetical protein
MKRVGYEIESEDVILRLKIKCPYCKTELFETVVKSGGMRTHTVLCLCCGEKSEYVI